MENTHPRGLIMREFGVDLPIGGGNGDSIDHAVIIEPQGKKLDHVSVEYAYLKYIGIGRRVLWEIIGQELLHYENKVIDKITLRVVQKTETEITTTEENYYFDITAVWMKRGGK